MKRPETPQEWNDLFRKITPAMQEHVQHYVTNISHAVSNTEGKAEGSGSYFECGGYRFVLTNDHVTKESNEKEFTHQFHGSSDVFRLAKPLLEEAEPVDLAICPVPDAIWSSVAHEAKAVPLSRFAERHAPYPREMLFFMGFSGERSSFWFETLISHGTPLLTQEMIPPVHGLHPNEFAINYNTEKSQTFDDSRGILPKPPGLSGSLVWNTRLVECMAAGREWSPELAQVTGILVRWTSGNAYVVAVRVEVIRDFLLRSITGNQPPP